MLRRAIWAGLVVVGLVAALATAGATVSAQDTGTVIIDGLNGPQGVLAAPDGSVWVIEGGTGGDDTVEMVDPMTGQVTEAMMGETARVIQVMPDGTQNVAVTLPSIHVGQDFIGGARLALLNGKLYATSGQWLAELGEDPMPLAAKVVEIADGVATPVGDMWAIENSVNPDEAQKDSHPYGLAAGPDGKLWVTDAGGNALLTVSPDSGDVESITAFAELPGVFPNPNRGGEMVTDPVPTGVTFDANGNAYVSLLSGAPFIPGSAKVMKVDARGEASDYATGLTMLTDIAAGPDGNLYAVQHAIFTDQGPTPNSGAIVKVVEGESSTPVVEGLSFPTSISFNEAGDAYVTVGGAGAPGSGAVVEFAGLAASAGDMAAEVMATETPAEEAAVDAGAAMTTTEMMTDTMATPGPAEEVMATETPMEEATAEPTEEMAAAAMATETPAMEEAAPEQLPTTGGGETHSTVLIALALLAVAALAGGTLALRKS